MGAIDESNNNNDRRLEASAESSLQVIFIPVNIKKPVLSLDICKIGGCVCMDHWGSCLPILSHGVYIVWGHGVKIEAKNLVGVVDDILQLFGYLALWLQVWQHA